MYTFHLNAVIEELQDGTCKSGLFYYELFRRLSKKNRYFNDFLRVILWSQLLFSSDPKHLLVVSEVSL